MSIEAMKQALGALELSDKLINGDESTLGLDGAMDGYYNGCFDIDGTNKRTNEAITALRRAIDQAEKQEPVMWVYRYTREDGSTYLSQVQVDERNPVEVPLYVMPPNPEILLTDEAIGLFYDKYVKTEQKAALAETEQEPVATLEITTPENWRFTSGHIIDLGGWGKRIKLPVGAYPLYAMPPKPEWLGLTDDDIDEILIDLMRQHAHGAISIARAVEAKLKGKNHDHI